MVKEKGGYDRTEHESSKINKFGDVIKWDTVGDKEYWSEKSMRQRSLEEMYPRLEDEDEKDYEQRLVSISETIRKLGRHATREISKETPIKINEMYVYGGTNEFGKPTADSDGKVRGYKFTKYVQDADAKSRYYSDIFAEQLIAQGIMEAVSDEKEARDNDLLNYTVSMPKNYESQKEIARFFVGPLDYREQTSFRGKFQEAGSKRYSPEHAKFVEKRKRSFSRKDRTTDQIESLIDGKMFEGYFYPLVRQGFFDLSKEHNAAAIIPSEYDDFADGHKVDFAVALPTESKNSNGETEIMYQPISFGLTIGHGNSKILNIKKKLDEDHGLADIDYPSTCLRKDIAPIRDIPHFALCLPRTEFGDFKENLAIGKLPSQEIQDLINYQVYIQAVHWASYWAKQETVSRKEREKHTQQFTNIAKYFWNRMEEGGDGKAAQIVFEMPQRHPDATRFITELGLNRIYKKGQI